MADSVVKGYLMMSCPLLSTGFVVIGTILGFLASFNVLGL
jgi:hypothetical protein